MTCQELEELSDREVFHEIEYTDAFEDMPESLQEKMSNDEIQQYIVDPQKEADFTNQLRIDKGNHFKVCSDENCKRLRSVWAQNETLKEFVKTPSHLEHEVGK